HRRPADVDASRRAAPGKSVSCRKCYLVQGRERRQAQVYLILGDFAAATGAARKPSNLAPVPCTIPALKFPDCKESMMSGINKVVLAYSGGLDTSVIAKWLSETYQCEVVTFTADLGQGGEVEPARAKAQALGIKEIYIEDLREEFVRDFVYPMFRANTLYEGEYLLGTSIARPLIAKRLIEI